MNLIDLMPKEVKNKLHRKAYSPNEIILFAEKSNDYVYFVAAGFVEAYVPNEQGSLSHIYTYKPGSFFGEVEQFYSGRKPVQVSAVTSCTVDRLHKDDFLGWMKKDFEIVKLVVREIAFKLIVNSDRIEELLHLTVKERLLRCIALHQYRGTLDRLTKSLISLEINTPLRSVNRAFAECVRHKLFCYKNKKVVILNQKHLPYSDNI